MALIGITSYGYNDKDQFYLPGNYIECVRRAGGAAVLIPPGETKIEKILSRIDGLLLAGGGDIGQTIYAGDNHPSIYNVDTTRDEMEVALTERVIELGMPMLGICRGIQIINIALGGSIHTHLPDVVGENVSHRISQDQHTTHEIYIENNSRLAEAIDVENCSPASWHHQAINEVGEGLKIVAKAPDDVIEAVEMSGHPWLIGVQWHPEITAKDDATQQKLFDAFVKAANEYNT